MKVLVRQPKIGMGDMIIYLPYIHAIAKKYKTKVSILVKYNSRASELLADDWYVDEIITLLRTKNNLGLHDGIKGFFKLIEEIKNLKDINEEKEIKLESVSKECEAVKEQLSIIETRKFEESETLTLDQEMIRMYQCEECDTIFRNNGDMKHHRRCFHGVESKKNLLNLRLYKLGKQISDQKLDLSLKISDLKEREETCKCVGWCGINHLKHSFKKSSSKELNHKFQKLIKGLKLY